MREWAEFTTEEAGGRLTVAISGPLRVSSIGKLDPQLRAIEEPVQTVDLSEVTEVDTVGAWVVQRFVDAHNASVVGASEQADVLMEAVREAQSTADVKPPQLPFFTRVPEFTGEKVVHWFQGVFAVLGFLGAVIGALFGSIRHLWLLCRQGPVGQGRRALRRGWFA